MIAHALLFFQAQQPSGTGFGSVFLFQMVAIVAIFYLFFIRPQRQREKRHQERLAQLKKGDEVVTAGGVVGRIVHLTDTDVTIKSDQSRLVVRRGRITEVAGEASEDTKS